MTEDGAELVLSWYLDLESRFVGTTSALGLGVAGDLKLPPLCPIIIEACSIMDSIFRDEYVDATPGIAEYAPHFESLLGLSGRRSLLFRYPPRLLCPFDGWVSTATNRYQSLDWWQAHNRLKHDRITHFAEATVANAQMALCALHLVISRMPVFLRTLLRKGMLQPGPWGLEYLLNSLETGERDDDQVTTLVESELFCTPVGTRDFPESVDDIDPIHFGYGERLWRFLGRKH